MSQAGETDPAMGTVLQLCDSSFPSGAFTCSWGLEGLVAAGDVHDRTTLEELVVDQLRHRWATFDRVVVHLVAAALDEPDGWLDAVVGIDLSVEAMSLPPVQRRASRAAGRTFLASAASVVGGELAERRRSLEAAGAPMHLAVTHPLVLLTVGAPLGVVEVASGLQLAQQLASAALRLGIVGHLGAQAVITRARHELDALLMDAPDAVPSQFVPCAEMAMYRHPRLPTRMFRC